MIATNKAWTAARERKPTRTIGQSARDPEAGFDIAYYGDLATSAGAAASRS